jgi:hypothetical protein
MQPVSVMTEPVKPAVVEEGARVPKDAIDPDLIKLRRTKLKVGVITAAGLVFLCAYFLIKLGPDRAFSGSGQPAVVPMADVLGDRVSTDSYIALQAEPLISHAIRTTQAKGNLGLRVVPARGTGERVWLVVSGDGWEPPATEQRPGEPPRAPEAKDAYIGRLRKLSDLSFAGVVRDFAAEHPRPMFATAAAIRAGFATHQVTTVTGDAVALTDADQVALDVVDPNEAVIVATFEPSVPTIEAWRAALTTAGIERSAGPGGETPSTNNVRFMVAMPNAVATVTTKLEAARLVASRVEPVTHHYQTTWGALRGSAPAGFTIDGTTIPDAQLDLVGLYVARAIPADAYALMIGDRPDDYWYVLPITIALAAIGLVFAWALIRAVRRDLMPTRAT